MEFEKLSQDVINSAATNAAATEVGRPITTMEKVAVGTGIALAAAGVTQGVILIIKKIKAKKIAKLQKEDLSK